MMFKCKNKITLVTRDKNKMELFDSSKNNPNTNVIISDERMLINIYLGIRNVIEASVEVLNTILVCS